MAAPHVKNLANRAARRNLTREGQPFFLDPALYRAFPPRGRPSLVALFNLLVGEARDPDVPIIRSTQLELAERMGCSRRTVQRLEARLEHVGAVRIRHDLEGLRGGRALELVPLVDWLPDGVWKGPAATSFQIVDNRGTVDILAPDGGQKRHDPPPELPHTARARQSQKRKSDPEERRDQGAPDMHLPPEILARRLFAFLARKAGVSGRSWKDAMPALETLARELGAEAAWTEVERIVVASRSAIRPGAYAFACLFPDGLPEKPRSPLHALGRLAEPGPLFQGLEPGTSGSAPASPSGARAGLDATPRTNPGPDAS